VRYFFFALLGARRIIASAVVVPGQGRRSPPAGRVKRRQSVSSANTAETSKRPRLNVKGGHAVDDQDSPSVRRTHALDETVETTDQLDTTQTKLAASVESDILNSRRRDGLEEEKRRGKRLFGALLGTIGKFQKETTSQRARSTAVKRKEVEAKLQEKLKAQTEELDGLRKKEVDNFNLRRRVETRDLEERIVSFFILCSAVNQASLVSLIRNRAVLKLFSLITSDEITTFYAFSPGKHALYYCHTQIGTSRCDPNISRQDEPPNLTIVG
jgi:hypothetical protein